jgi:hypothetical protein
MEKDIIMKRHHIRLNRLPILLLHLHRLILRAFFKEVAI